MKKQNIKKILLTTMLTCMVSASAMANDLNEIKFGETVENFKKQQSEQVYHSGYFNLKDFHAIYVVPETKQIFNQKSTNTQYKFFKNVCYGVEYELEKTTEKDFEIAENTISRELKVTPQKGGWLAKDGCKEQVRKWSTKDNDIFLEYHPSNKHQFMRIIVNHKFSK